MRTPILTALMASAALVGTAMAQVTVVPYIVEDEVQDTDNFPFLEESALEPALIGVRTNTSPPQLVFGENNVSGSTGNSETRLFAFDVDGDPVTEQATQILLLGDDGGTGALQAASALNSTEDIYIRQSAGSVVGDIVYFLAAADSDADGSEFVETDDIDHVIAVDLTDSSVDLVQAFDGAGQIVVSGGFVYGEVFDGTEASIQRFPTTGGTPTTIVTQSDLQTALGVTATDGIFIDGLAVDGSGDLVVLVDSNATGIDPSVLTINTPGATASINATPRISSTLLASSSLGAVAPRGGVAVTASGRIVVNTIDAADDVDASEGILIFNAAGDTVEQVVTGAAIIDGADDRGTAGATLRTFNPDVIAYESGGVLTIFIATQDNEEFIARIDYTLPGANVQSWDLY